MAALTGRDLCSLEGARTAHPQLCGSAAQRANVTSPASPAGARLPAACKVNQQEGMWARTAASEPALLERLDMAGLPCHGVTMASILESMARQGKVSGTLFSWLSTRGAFAAALPARLLRTTASPPHHHPATYLNS